MQLLFLLQILMANIMIDMPGICMIIENDCCIVCTPPPLSAGGGGIEPGTKFSKREGALQDLNF